MSLKDALFGRLTLDAFKHDLVQTGAVVGMVLAGIAVVALITYLHRWKWLWKEWLTTVDPKRIGVMYMVVVFLMLIKGLVDALMMRAQQFLSVGESFGYLSADHFQQVFSAHGTTMIFFVGMGSIFGLMNLIIPLQIGARDVAYPFLNALGFWLFASAAMLLMVSLAIGDFAITGWLAYPPLSGIEYSPNEGVDYWIWILQIAGVGSTMSGINFLATIFKMRCPGMTLMKMPMFVWACLCTLVLVIFAFPILTATLLLLTLDRYLGMHFFTASFGGNPMMYVNLIWAWGHPEVYILILPTFGVFSEVVATFSKKRLFGYHTMVYALVVITVLSFIVWLHHFFTMGASASVNAIFGITTELIAIPTGVKIFNWIATQYKGRVQFTTPLLWFLAFVFIFTIGGMAGVLLSIPPVDFQLHNSLFLVAHFHSVIIGGVLFGFFAAYTYWLPKFVGFKLNDKYGKAAFWCWIIGFLLAFMPLYQLGLMGATRRLDHYEVQEWHNFFSIAMVGVLVIFTGVGFQILQIAVSIKERKTQRDTTGDSWHEGRTLEWTTASPPPHYNFAIIPMVDERDPFWEWKKLGKPVVEKPHYKPIHMPINTPYPVLIGIGSFLFGFGMTWHITWMILVGFIGSIVCLIIRLCEDHIEETIPVAEIEKIESEIANRKLYA